MTDGVVAVDEAHVGERSWAASGRGGGGKGGAALRVGASFVVVSSDNRLRTATARITIQLLYIAYQVLNHSLPVLLVCSSMLTLLLSLSCSFFFGCFNYVLLQYNHVQKIQSNHIGHQTGILPSPVLSIIIVVYLFFNYLFHYVRFVLVVFHQL